MVARYVNIIRLNKPEVTARTDLAIFPPLDKFEIQLETTHIAIAIN
jgi:hypothetical protein